MIPSSRIVNIFFFLLLSVAVTIYLYNQAFISENNQLSLQVNEEVSRLISHEIQNSLQGLSNSIYGSNHSKSFVESIHPKITSTTTLSSSFSSSSIPVTKESIFQENIRLLSSKITETLEWASMLGTDSKSPLQWDKISVADLHILRKLLKYIQNQPNLNLASIEKGHQCTEIQKLQQLEISKYITMDICSEIEWYKLAHLTFPEAKLIFDVGGNKGYLGSLFLGLWGGGGYKINPALLFEQSKISDVWKGSRNPAGYCKDGLNYAMALHCHQPLHSRSFTSTSSSTSKDMKQITLALSRDIVTGQCTQLREDIHVHSFDGSSYLQACVQGLTKSLSIQEPKILKAWTYHHNAISDTIGTVRFTKQGADQRPGFEGGRIRMDTTVETEEVNMTSVDVLLQSWGLKNKLDILKIDTEGNDNKVIVGANQALKDSIGLLTFEGGGGVTFSKTMSDELDQIGFSCYSTSRAGLFKWNANCMIETFFGDFRQKDKGNIFCVSRTRVPLMAMAFDALSFPLLISANYDRLDITTEEKISLNKTIITKSFVNVKKFCNPWPTCVMM